MRREPQTLSACPLCDGPPRLIYAQADDEAITIIRCDHCSFASVVELVCPSYESAADEWERRCFEACLGEFGGFDKIPVMIGTRLDSEGDNHGR